MAVSVRQTTSVDAPPPAASGWDASSGSHGSAEPSLDLHQLGGFDEHPYRSAEGSWEAQYAAYSAAWSAYYDTHYPGRDPEAKSMRVCRHHLMGRCTWGNLCRFSHDLEGPLPAAFATSGGGPALQQAALPSGIAQEQQAVQEMRHAVLEAALLARFQIRSVAPLAGEGGGEGGSKRASVLLTSLANAPDVSIRVLDAQEVRDRAAELDSSKQLSRRGLHFLVGEADLFWSMMRLWHVERTTGVDVWDEALDAAEQGADVRCMFHGTRVGCQSTNCVYLHDPRGGVNEMMR